MLLRDMGANAWSFKFKEVSWQTERARREENWLVSSNVLEELERFEFCSGTS